MTCSSRGDGGTLTCSCNTSCSCSQVQLPLSCQLATLGMSATTYIEVIRNDWLIQLALAINLVVVLGLVVDATRRFFASRIIVSLESLQDLLNKERKEHGHAIVSTYCDGSPLETFRGRRRARKPAEAFKVFRTVEDGVPRAYRTKNSNVLAATSSDTSTSLPGRCARARSRERPAMHAPHAPRNRKRSRPPSRLPAYPVGMVYHPHAVVHSK